MARNIDFTHIDTKKYLLSELFDLVKNQYPSSIESFKVYLAYHKIEYKKEYQCKHQKLYALIDNITTERHTLHEIHQIIAPHYTISLKQLKGCLNTKKCKYKRKGKKNISHPILLKGINTQKYTLEELKEKAQFEGSFEKFKQLILQNNILFKQYTKRKFSLKVNQSTKEVLDTLDTSLHSIHELLIILKNNQVILTEKQLRSFMSECNYPFKPIRHYLEEAKLLNQLDTSQYTLKEIHILIKSQRTLATLYYYLTRKNYPFKRENKK